MNYCVWFVFAATTLLFPEVSSFPRSQVTRKIREGKTVSLPCHVPRHWSETSAHVIEWFRSSEKMPILIKIGKRPAHTDPLFQAYEDLYRRHFTSGGKAGRVSISESASLSVRNVTLSDAGFYRCVRLVLRGSPAIFTTGHETTVELLVTAPPSFTTVPPRRVEGRRGSSLLLACEAIGVPPPVITWLRDGRQISGGQNGYQLTETTLRVSSLSRTHAGTYTCRAQSVEGLATHHTMVYVSAPPRLFITPEDITTVEGKDVYFSCRANGYPSDIKYRWFHNRVPVTGKDQRKQILQDGTLIVRSIRVSDRGQVTCEASNGYGSAPRSSAALTVHYKARVTLMPKQIFAGVSFSFTLHCPAAAVPPVNKVVWRKDGRHVNIQENSRYDTDGNGSIIIRRVLPRDAGNYYCTPYNQIGTLGESTGTKVVIKEPPRFLIRPNPAYQAISGKQLVVPCVGVGDPPPNVSWRKVKSRPRDLTYCIKGGNLSIAAARKEHHGMWKCIVSNAVGDVVSDVMINVKNTTPHPVQNVSAYVISDSSIRVTWIPGYDGDHKQHFTLWYKRADKGDHEWQTIYVSDDQHKALLNQLKSSTFYQISIIPRNELGRGPFSDTVTVKTKVERLTTSTPLIPVSPPGVLGSSTNDDGTVTIEWEPVHRQDGLLGYLVEYRRLGRDPSSPEEEESTALAIPSVAAELRETRESLKGRQKRNLPSDSSWNSLDTTSHNVTSYQIAPDQMYRDQIYEFQVLAVTATQYSQPSSPFQLSTKGLLVYPCLVEQAPSLSFALRHPVVIGVLCGSIGVLVLIALVVALVCKRRLGRTKKKRGVNEGIELSENYGKENKKQSNEQQAAAKHSQHIICNDGFSSLSCLGRRRSEVVMSTTESPEKREKWDVGEELSLLRPNPTSDKEFSELRSLDEESIRRRRATTARVMYAQQMGRAENISSKNAGMYRTLQAPLTYPDNSCYLHYDRSYVSSENSSTTRYLTLEDRRRNAEPQGPHDDSCYVVVQEAGQENAPHAAVNTFVPSPSNDNVSHTHDGVIVGCRGDRRLEDLSPTQQEPLLSSSPKQSNPFFRASSAVPTGRRPFSPDKLTQKARSRASYSLDQRGHASQRYSTTGVPVQLPASDPTSFEIDCSNSDIEVRFINSNHEVPKEAEENSSFYKIESNPIDQKEVKRRMKPTVTDLAIRAHNASRDESYDERCKRLSLEALLSPTRHLPPSPIRQMSRNDVPASHAETATAFQRVSNKKKPKSYAQHHSSSVQGAGEASNRCEAFVAAPRSSRLRDSLDGTPTTQNRAVQKPTVVPLSDIAWDLVRTTSSTFGTPASPLSPARSHYKSPAATTRAPTSRTSSVRSPVTSTNSESKWGSLGRSARLQNLSLRTSTTPVSASGQSYLKTRNRFFPETLPANQKSQQSGRRSLPGSPTKLTTSKQWASDLSDDDELRGIRTKRATSRARPRSKERTPKSVVSFRGPDDPSAAASTSPTSPSFRRHRSQGESLSSGYATQDNTQLSPGSLKGQSERSRRENSSAEENYEWDADFAMESEILEAVRKYNSTQPGSTLSEELREELLKLASDKNNEIPSTTQETTHAPTTSRDLTSPNEPKATSSKDASSDEGKTKQTEIERRCAALRQEYHYRLLQQQVGGTALQVASPTANSGEPL